MPADNVAILDPVDFIDVLVYRSCPHPSYNPSFVFVFVFCVSLLLARPRNHCSTLAQVVGHGQFVVGQRQKVPHALVLFVQETDVAELRPILHRDDRQVELGKERIEAAGLHHGYHSKEQHFPRPVAVYPVSRWRQPKPMPSVPPKEFHGRLPTPGYVEIAHEAPPRYGTSLRSCAVRALCRKKKQTEKGERSGHVDGGIIR